MEFLFWFFGIIFSISAFFSLGVIFLENRDPSKTLAWFLLFILFPGVGFFIYIIFGQNMRKKKICKTQKLYNEIKESKIFDRLIEIESMIDIQKQAIKENMIFNEENMQSSKRIMNLLLNTGKSPFTISNKIEILTNGDKKFERLFYDLKKAKETIHLEYYIIKDSIVGNELKNILIKKAREGVKIKILYDDVGCWNLWFKRTYFKQMKDEGIQIVSFLPVKLPFLNKRINYRNHRKIVVIDGKIAYTGGINVGDEYLGRSKKFGFWRDTHMKIEGEAVYIVQMTFLLDWYFSTKQKLFDRLYFPKIECQGKHIMQIAASGPDSDWENIHKAYFSAITLAKKKIYIETPYFIPDDSLLMALKSASLSGVDVRIIFPGIADHKVVYAASLSYFDDILKSGGKVYFYNKGFLHCKILIIDDNIASLGSANMDLRSFMLNFEMNGFIYSEDVVKKLHEDFLEDLKNSTLIDVDEYLNRPITQKIKESAARLFSPIL